MNICGYPVIIKIKVRPEEFHNGITLEELENLLKSGETGKKSKLCQQNAFLVKLVQSIWRGGVPFPYCCGKSRRA